MFYSKYKLQHFDTGKACLSALTVHKILSVKNFSYVLQIKLQWNDFRSSIFMYIISIMEVHQFGSEN
jgi:hypothetical protein